MIYLDDADVMIHRGDALAVLAELPDESVHMCVTSPPFFGLRDYDVDGQIGLEETPEEWCDRLVAVFREVRRVLRKDGTLWLELGDSYATRQAGGGFGNQSSTLRRGRLYPKDLARHAIRTEGARAKSGNGTKPKDLIGVPWLLAFALRADGWYLRADVIWGRSNPMPESVRDRPTRAHSYLFLLAKSARYFYDEAAIREPATWDRWGDQTSPKYGNRNVRAKGKLAMERTLEELDLDRRRELGRNKRSVWIIPTQPLPEEHYAAFPEALVEPCVKAGTSERGCCPQCGAPWARVVERESARVGSPDAPYPNANGRTLARGSQFTGATASTVGWRPSCSCYEPFYLRDFGPSKAWRREDREARRIWLYRRWRERVLRRPGLDSWPTVPAVVLDPFLGSGTTAIVARQLRRRSVGIELKAAYCKIAARRLSQQTLFADTGEMIPVDTIPLRTVDDDRSVPVHRRGRDSERAAADFVRPRAGTGRAKVLAAINAAADRGATDYELAQATGLRLYTAAPRRVELLRDGWIVDSGRRRPTDSGSLAVAWVLSDRGRLAAAA